MDLNKKNIIKTLEKITFSGETANIVSSGVLQNVQVFGDQVDIGLLVSNPALQACLLYTSPSPRDATLSRMPSSA